MTGKLRRQLDMFVGACRIMTMVNVAWLFGELMEEYRMHMVRVLMISTTTTAMPGKKSVKAIADCVNR